MIRLGLLLCLLLSGCTQAPTTAVQFTPVPDHQDYCQRDKTIPWMRIWDTGTVNLWLAQKDLRACPHPPRSTFYSVALTGEAPAFYAFLGDTIRGVMTDSYADSLTTVQGASFWLVASGDTLLTGLAVTQVLGPCGGRADSTSLVLDRQDTP